MLKAILFDCDGVIAETEVSRFQHIKKLAEEKGHVGLNEKEHLKHLIGKRSADFLRTVFGEKISGQEIEAIVNKRYKDWEEKPEQFITEMRGIKAACGKLMGKYELAVASTATRLTVETTLKHLDLMKYFKAVVTGSDVKKSKPDPAVYLETLKRLGRKSEECVAIEDSEFGITAAKQAGIKVIGLRNTLYEEYGHRQNLSEADFIIDELTDLPELVEEETQNDK